MNTTQSRLLWQLGAWASTCAIGVAIYQPFRVRPFDIHDFWSFLPLLRSESSPGGQLIRLIQHFAAHGRLNALQHAGLVAKWNLFGDAIVGWQCSRALVMIALCGMTSMLLQRLGATRTAGWLGASIFLFAPAAREGWLRLPMAEPVATLLLVCMSMAAVRFQATASWRRDAAFLAVGAASTLLLKEALVPLLLLPLALALGFPDRVGRTLGRRDTALLVSFALPVALVGAAVVVVYLERDTGAYASAYGSWDSVAVPVYWLSTVLPLDLVPERQFMPWAFGLLGFALLVGFGWRAAVQTGKRRMTRLLSAALVFPLLGGLTYAPWPAFQTFYLLPSLVATAVLTAISITALEAHHRRGRLAAIAASALVLVNGLVGAANASSRSDAVKRAIDGTITLVASLRLDSVIVFEPKPRYAGWPGLTTAMAQLGAATARPWPSARSEPCPNEPPAVGPRVGVAVVAFESVCRAAWTEPSSVSISYRTFDWSTWQFRDDSIRVRIID